MKNLRYSLRDGAIVCGVLMAMTCGFAVLFLAVPDNNCLKKGEVGTIDKIVISDGYDYLLVRTQHDKHICSKASADMVIPFEIGQNISRDNHLTIGVPE